VQAQSLLYAGYLSENAKPNKEFRLGKTNLFNQMYIESGVKFSTQSDLIGNLSNSQIGLQHQLSKKLQLFHAYNYLSQNVWWGTITQQSYYANFEYKQNNNLKLNLAGSFLHSNTLIYRTASDSGSIVKSNNPYISLSATIKLNKFYVKPYLGFSQLNNLKDQHNQFQSGGELLFDTYDNEGLVFGLGVFHFSNNMEFSTLIKPSISYIINDELTIAADYFYAHAKNFSDQDGYIIYNSTDKTYDRTNLTLKYEFANNLFLYTIYQFERKQDYSTNVDYSFNSIFLGIKYNQ
jgi:hypothetical protein